MIGKIVTVTVDRPLGSSHPDYPDMIYPVNYGYVAGVRAPDGEEQDAYILGIDTPVSGVIRNGIFERCVSPDAFGNIIYMHL